MNRIFSVFRPLIAASVLVVSGAAFAQEATPDTWISSAQSTKSRAEVRAEFLQARAEGRIARNDSEEKRLAMDSFQSKKTRAQVIAETREAMRLGLIPRNEWDVMNIAPTPEQLQQVAAAGLRARNEQLAAAR
jgi:Domain of unknown function (DUF4148)